MSVTGDKFTTAEMVQIRKIESLTAENKRLKDGLKELLMKSSIAVGFLSNNGMAHRPECRELNAANAKAKELTK